MLLIHSADWRVGRLMTLIRGGDRQPRKPALAANNVAELIDCFLGNSGGKRPDRFWAALAVTVLSFMRPGKPEMPRLWPLAHG